MTREKLILIGGGGHCRSCIDVIEEEGKYEIAGIVDLKEMVGKTTLGYKIIASDEDIPDLAGQYGYFLITIGQIKSPEKRIKLFQQLKSLNVVLPVIVSPLAHVSKRAEVGEGTIVMHHAMINANARVGVNCIINSKALIEHDANIGDHCHISTGCLINGNVKVGNECFVGSNVVVAHDCEIDGNTVVGAGSAVLKHLRGGGVFLGNPAICFK